MKYTRCIGENNVDIYTHDGQQVGLFHVLFSKPVDQEFANDIVCIECKADIKDVTLDILSIINHDSAHPDEAAWLLKIRAQLYFFSMIRYLDYDGQYITFTSYCTPTYTENWSAV